MPENQVNIIQQCVSKPYIFFKNFKIIKNAMNFIMQYVVQDRNSTLNTRVLMKHMGK